MKPKFWLCKRNQVFYSIDSETDRRESLHTRNAAEAERIIRAKNDAIILPTINVAIAKAYLVGIDPKLVERTWDFVMQEFCAVKKTAPGCAANGQSRARHSIPFATSGWYKQRRKIFMPCSKPAGFMSSTSCAVCTIWL